MVFVSGFPPFDSETGTVVKAPIERQTELVLEQMKLCLETAGSSMEHVLKCNVYCTSVELFAAVNAVYASYFPKNPPARIFICVPVWPRPFDRDRLCRGSEMRHGWLRPNASIERTSQRPLRAHCAAAHVDR